MTETMPGSQFSTGKEAVNQTFESKFNGKVEELVKAELELKELREKFNAINPEDNISFKDFQSFEGLEHFDDFRLADHDLVQDYVAIGKNESNLTIIVEPKHQEGEEQKVSRTISIYQVVDSHR